MEHVVELAGEASYFPDLARQLFLVLAQAILDELFDLCVLGRVEA